MHQIPAYWYWRRHDEPPGFVLLNLIRQPRGIVQESRLQGLGIRRAHHFLDSARALDRVARSVQKICDLLLASVSMPGWWANGPQWPRSTLCSPRLRIDARGCDGDVREKLAQGLSP